MIVKEISFALQGFYNIVEICLTILPIIKQYFGALEMLAKNHRRSRPAPPFEMSPMIKM